MHSQISSVSKTPWFSFREGISGRDRWTWPPPWCQGRPSRTEFSMVNTSIGRFACQEMLRRRALKLIEVWNVMTCAMCPCAHVPYIISVSRDSMIDWIEDWNQKMWNTTSKIIDKLTESLNIEKIPFLISFNHPPFAQPLLLQPMAIAVHVTCQDDQSRFGEVVSSENQTCSQDNAKKTQPYYRIFGGHVLKRHSS